jgi:hypothetical protein
VVACSLALLLCAVAAAVGWALSRETRVTSYRVLGNVSGVELDVDAASVAVDGGSAADVEVLRTDRFAFGTSSRERRSVAGGRLRVVSRCPRTVLGTCSVSYRVTVPDNVPVAVRATSGRVDMDGLRGSASIVTASGPVRVDEFCGFSLRAVSATGSVSAAAECSPEQVELRSGSGDVRALVPPGRYEVDAQSDAGRSRVRGLDVAQDAPFRVEALSRTGAVFVGAAA